MEDSTRKRLATVLRDKAKIQSAIETLEEHKKVALKKTWETVDRYTIAYLHLLMTFIENLELYSTIFYQGTPRNSFPWIRKIYPVAWR